jgi:hypothetical protein
MGLKELIQSLQDAESRLGNLEVLTCGQHDFADNMTNTIVRVVATFEEQCEPTIILLTE